MTLFSEILLVNPLDKESKAVSVSVTSGNREDVTVGVISIGDKTNWDYVDSLVRRVFKEFLKRLDPASCLGLSEESVVSYELGEITRTVTSDVPELLPCGYLVGDVNTIRLTLRGASTNSVDSLAFHALVPKSIMQRYV